MESKSLIPHLFRTEYSRIVAVLCKCFGFEHIAVAEDLASETFLSALNTWPYKGIPDNPTAWLFTVAKHKALNYLSHEHSFKKKVADELPSSGSHTSELIPLTESNISDSQLQMMFAICHPSISPEAQIGLALRILCGFGIDEIANAFLTSKETINKRLFRAKEKLRHEKVAIEFPPAYEIANRTQAVLTTLYLLFNEGYYSESHESILREDLCLEAMKLNYLMLQHPLTNLPEANALLALMCFHASRFEARKKNGATVVLYHEQDETLWDAGLITKGTEYLRKASIGETLTRYHLEATIAFWHTQKSDSIEKWQHILHLYNQLLIQEYSPIAALNRTYALAKVKGKAEAIKEAEKLNLSGNHFFHALLGELYQGIDSQKAKACLERAFGLAKTKADRETIQSKLSCLQQALATE